MSNIRRSGLDLTSISSRKFGSALVLVERILHASGRTKNRDESRSVIRESRVVRVHNENQMVTLVNNTTDKFDPEHESVLFDQIPVRMPRGPVFILLNKPRNVLSALKLDPTSMRKLDKDADLNWVSILQTLSEVPSPEISQFVTRTGSSEFEVDASKRPLFLVGRLDVDTQGLILFTNDGFLSSAMTQPVFKVCKEYIALIIGTRLPRFIDQFGVEHCVKLESGVVLGCGNIAQPKYVQVLSSKEARHQLGASYESFVNKLEFDLECYQFVKIGLTQGKYREVRRMIRKLGFYVSRLARLSLGAGIRDSELQIGHARFLSDTEVSRLYSQILPHALPTDVIYDFRTESWISPIE